MMPTSPPPGTNGPLVVEFDRPLVICEGTGQVAGVLADVPAAEDDLGVVGLDREEADLVKGKNSKRTAELLGLGARSELVHRDNMVVLMGLEAKTA